MKNNNKSQRKILWVIISMIFIAAFVVAWSVKQSDSFNAGKNTKQSNSFDNAKAHLSGILKLNICGGAQPDIPVSPPCEASTASRTLVEVINNGQTVASTQTDSEGRYSFDLKPGAYNLRVKGESMSDVHEVNVNAGNNQYNFTANFHTP